MTCEVDDLIDGGDPNGAKRRVLEALKNGDPWTSILRMSNRFVMHGLYEPAAEVLQALEAREKKAGLDRIWIRYAQAQLGIRMDGIGRHRGRVESLLVDKLPTNVKATLRRLLIAHLDEIEDCSGMERHLAEVLSETPSLTSVRLAERLALKHKLKRVTALLGETTTFDASPVVASSSLPAHELDCGEPGKTPRPAPLRNGVLDCPPTNVFVIERAAVVTLHELAFVFDSEDRLVRPCSNSPLQLFEDELRRGLQEARASSPIEGNTAFIRDRFLAHNYCHWLLDVLPRLAVCEQTGLSIDAIACSGVATSFERQSLSITGYQAQRIVPCESAATLSFERLIVPDNISSTHRHPMQFMHPDLLSWWERHLPAPRRGSKDKRRLFLPRKKNRCVVNGTELAAELHACGFEEVTPETLSLDEQVALFGQAEAVVGSHGAALTNLLFAPRGCRVLELFPHIGGTAAYQILSAGRGHDYEFYKSPPAGSDSWFNDFPITADLGVVRQWLEVRGLT